MKKVFLSAVFTTLLFILIQIICSSFGIILQGKMLESNLSLFLLFPIIGDVLFGIGMLLYLGKENVRALCRISSVPFRKYIISVVLIMVYSIAGNIILYTLPTSNTMEIMEGSMKINPLLYSLAVYLVAPIAEEFVFRGFIQTRLRTVINVFTAILLSSALFGLTHLITGSLPTVMFAFVGGIIFGITYEKLGSLLPVIVIHIVGNLSEQLAMNLIV